MLERRESDQAIARSIRDPVRIVLISPEECERLDRRAQMGLRQTMPGSWKIGDDIFARLTEANIEWDAEPAEDSSVPFAQPQ